MVRKYDLDREKEFFRLWIEYLKRSDDYKQFCEWVVEKRKNPKLPPPTKFKKDSKTGNAPKEIFNYVVFGPIHDPRWTFDEWWKNHQERKSHRKTHSIPRSIEDYIKNISRHMKSCAESFERHEGREPTLKEFIDTFPSYLKKEPFIFLMVDIGGVKTEELKDQFGKLINQKRKEPYFKAWDWRCRRHFEPVSGKKMIDELRKYLKVYDLREDKIPWIKIITEEFGYNFNENTRRAFLLHRQNARNIIKMVEHGYFPGEFRKRQSRRDK